MHRFSLVVLLPVVLLIAGCTESAPLPGSESAVQNASLAIEAGDATEALRLLRYAAEHGDLWAIRTLADAHERGYLRAESVGQARHVSFRVWPGSASRWQRRYAEALARGVEAGEPDALMLRAEALTSKRFEEGAWIEPSEADRAEAEALMERAAAQGHVPALMHLAFASLNRDDRAEAAAWLDRAEAAGGEQACLLRVHLVDRLGNPATADELVYLVDRLDACGASENAAEVVGALRRQADEGNVASAELLDEARALGLFERHPHLDGGRL